MLRITGVILTTTLLTAMLYPQTISTAGVDEIKALNQQLAKYYKDGELDKALAAAERLVEVAKTVYGKDDLNVALALKNRGNIALQKGDINKAERSFDEAIDVIKSRKTISMQEAGTLASILENLGRIRFKQNSSGAEGIFKEALKWRETVGGPQSPEIATPLAYLANFDFWRRDYKAASEKYGRALTALNKPSNISLDEYHLIYYRAQCSYQKAGLANLFDQNKQLFSQPATSGAAPPLSKGGVVNGKAVYLERPKFPLEARNARAAGTVSVQVLINERGDVISACSVPDRNDHPALVEVAELAAYKSRFSPTLLSGTPVKVSGVITYNFVPR